MIAHPSILVASICLSLTSSIFSFSFETWMVVQHEKVCYDIIVHFYFHLEKTLGVGATIFPHGSDLAFIVCFYLIKY